MAGSSGGKSGGNRAMAQPVQAQGQFAPLAPQGNFNVNEAAAGGLQQAMQGRQWRVRISASS